MNTTKKRMTWLWVLLLFLGLPCLLLGLRQLTLPYRNFTDAQRQVYEYAKTNGLSYWDYPESIISLLERNPETADFVLEYPVKKNLPPVTDLSEYADSEAVPLFLQWDQRWGYQKYGSDVAGLTGCGPLCLSMVGYYLTEDPSFAPSSVLTFATENGYYARGFGSSWTLISEGGPKLGLKVKELPLVEKKIFDNLEAGNPIITVLGPGDFTSTGHYIVLTGVKDGLIQVNDPNSIQNSETLWSYETLAGQIKNLWAIQP